MPEFLREKRLVSQIHAATGQLVLAITGGGSRAIAHLLEMPGGSKTLLEAVVPYSTEALAEFLHAKPEQNCSARTARTMAMAAFQRARGLQRAANQSAPTIGVGCTASLVSDRPKLGPHRIHVALQTIDTTTTYSLELTKGSRSRVQEEGVATRMVLNAVAEAFGVDDRLTERLEREEEVEWLRTAASKEWQDLLMDRTEAVCHLPENGMQSMLEAGSAMQPSADVPRAIFPGAFNPLHAGHLRMAEIVATRLGTDVEFELSIENVDKPPLDYTEMDERAAQFIEVSYPLWFTRAPTFEEKSRLFPGATFIVGADTLLRIGQAKYYGNNRATAEAAIARIGQRDCRFLMFGRLIEGKVQTLDDLLLPESLRALCDEVPVGEFRQDISSTELRQSASNEE